MLDTFLGQERSDYEDQKVADIYKKVSCDKIQN